MHELEYPDFRLSGQVALITGASRGIGFGIARALAHAGAKAAVAARSRGDLDGLVESICAEGGTAEAFPLDIHDLDQVRACVAAVGESFGRLDILVNNAGLGANHPALDVTEADWDEMIDVNLKGLFFCSQAAARAMLRQGCGRIVNRKLSGERRRHPRSRGLLRLEGRRQSAHARARAQVVGAGCHRECRRPDVHLYTGTAERLDDPAYLENVLARLPIGRVGTINAAAAVIYLASPAGAMRDRQCPHDRRRLYGTIEYQETKPCNTAQTPIAIPG